MTTPVSPAVLMGQHGYDPRGSSLDGRGEDVQRMDNDLIDPRINQMPLEVYFHYAKLERERELTAPGPEGSFYTRMFKKATGTNRHEHVISDADESTVDKEKEKNSSSAVVVTESERHHAYRALRTASWQGVFFLITTDILGPSSAPQALNYLGYGGGILVYFFFYVMAFFAGQSLWREYMEMDSALYPVKCFADLGERLLGRTFRHICNITQSLQLVLNVAILLEGNAVTLATLIDYKLCYIVITLLWMLSGMIGGQIKSLRNFAVFANLNIFLNVVVIVMTIAGCSVYAPIPTLNFPTATAPFDPVMHTAFADATYGWYRQVAGVQYAVFAYGGAMIFVEFMAEMRRPRDFWKAAFYAQTFIFVVYLIYGVVIYYFQGQYTYIIPSLNVTNAKFQLAVNVIGLFTTMIAAVLYGNIGVKIFYFNILQAYFKFPELTTRGGRIAWTFTVIGYWGLAFVLASAIPNLGSLIVLVGALCILQFTYTFPPLMWCAYMIKRHAMEADRPWTPGMELYSNRVDSWKDASRWKRGIAKQWYIKAFLILLFLGALALSGLGCYAGIKGIIDTFATAGSATSFGCRAPGQPA